LLFNIRLSTMSLILLPLGTAQHPLNDPGGFRVRHVARDHLHGSPICHGGKGNALDGRAFDPRQQFLDSSNVAGKTCLVPGSVDFKQPLPSCLRIKLANVIRSFPL